jgi:hypothetical protein
MRGIGPYRILMDNKWGLTDLYDFPHALAQTYASFCFASDLSPRDAERINDALRDYPWKGGYSIVNIYTVLQNQVPTEYRPKINSIKYASPGWIELILHVDSVVHVAAAVAAIAGSAVAVTKAYAAIQRILHDIRNENDRAALGKFLLLKEQATALRGLCDELSKLIGFNKFHELVKRTDGDLEVAAKLLCAQFRRLKNIAEYTKKGQVDLPITRPSGPQGTRRLPGSSTER